MGDTPAMRVLGVDPGTRLAGWAVLAEGGAAGEPTLVASGTLRLDRGRPDAAERLRRLHDGLGEVLDAHRPDVVALEAAYFGVNARSALKLGEARGAVLLLAATRGLAVAELSPATVKRRVAGNGNASKEQVAALVRVRLALDPAHDFATPDESDAAAVALCALVERALPAAAASPVRRRRRTLPPGARFQDGS